MRAISSTLFGFVFFLSLHVAIWRLWPSRFPRIFLLSFLALAGFIFSAVGDGAFHGADGVELCSIAWLWSFAAVFYFFIYAGIARSVSVTLLARLAQTRGSKMKGEELAQDCLQPSRFEDRIALMQKQGWIRFHGQKALLTSSGASLVLFFKFLSRFLAARMEG